MWVSLYICIYIPLHQPYIYYINCMRVIERCHAVCVCVCVYVCVCQTVMRLLDNCSLDPENVKDIQDDINYYLDCNQVSIKLALLESVLC